MVLSYIVGSLRAGFKPLVSSPHPPSLQSLETLVDSRVGAIRFPLVST